MSTQGLDPNQVAQLARRFESAQASINSAQSAVSEAVGRSFWQGPAADRFRARWQTEHAPHLRRVATDCGALSRTLRSELHQQQQASNSFDTADQCRVPPTLIGKASDELPPSTVSGPDGAAELMRRLRKVPPGQYQILQTNDVPPKLIVLMPGIEDLEGIGRGVVAQAAGLGITRLGAAAGGLPGLVAGLVVGDQVADLIQGDSDPTERRLANAAVSAVAGRDADVYAALVSAGVDDYLEANGLARGTEVMLVGHSYGAIASGHLVNDPSFNGGTVKVVDWLGAAAGQYEEGFRAPEHTAVYLSDNRFDPVVHLGISGNSIDHRGTEVSTVPRSFASHTFNSFSRAHSEDTYADHIAKAPEFSSFGAGFGSVVSSTDMVTVP
jgi:hypothetical protein